VEGRSALRASIRVGGRRLWVATTHLARDPSTGICQLRDLLPHLTGVHRLVLAGDFNMQTHTEVRHPRCDGVPLRGLDQLSAAGLQRGEPGAPTYPAHAPDEHIDHFFATPSVDILDVRPRDNCYRGRCSSDHRPLLARIRVPG
jgi:endonuclease/exonuclease/phosphatase family metal-dependent hydrolase